MPQLLKQFRKKVNKTISFAFLPIDLLLEVVSLLGMGLFISKGAGSKTALNVNSELLDKAIQIAITFTPFQTLMINDFQTIYNNKTLDEYFSRFEAYKIVKERYRTTQSIYSQPQPLDYLARILMGLFKELTESIEIAISILREAPITRLLFENYKDKISEEEENNLVYCINKLYNYVNLNNPKLAEIFPNWEDKFLNPLYTAFANTIFVAITLLKSYEKDIAPHIAQLQKRTWIRHGNLKITLIDGETLEKTELFDGKATEATYNFVLDNFNLKTKPFQLELDHEGFKVLATQEGEVKAVTNYWLNESYDLTNNRFNPYGRTLIALVGNYRLLAIRPDLTIVKQVWLPDAVNFIIQNRNGDILAFRTTDYNTIVYVYSPRLTLKKTVTLPFTRIETLLQCYQILSSKTIYVVKWWRRLQTGSWHLTVGTFDSDLNVLSLNFVENLNPPAYCLSYITPSGYYLCSQPYYSVRIEPTSICEHWGLHVYDNKKQFVKYNTALNYCHRTGYLAPHDFSIPCVRHGNHMHFSRVRGNIGSALVDLNQLIVYDSRIPPPTITFNNYALLSAFFESENKTHIRIYDENDNLIKTLFVDGNYKFNHGAINSNNIALLSGIGTGFVVMDMKELEIIRTFPIVYNHITAIANNNFYAVRDGDIMHRLDPYGNVIGAKRLIPSVPVKQIIAIPHIL